MTNHKADPKTPAQLQSEIAYFEQRKRQTKSPDRLARLETAIRTRQKKLAEALKVVRDS
jgi:hypothetical protein